jgi:hypothetical protein
MLGMIGPPNSMLTNFLFNAVNTKRDGKLSFEEYLEWLLVATVGTEEDKARIGYTLCSLGVHDKESVSKEEAGMLVNR